MTSIKDLFEQRTDAEVAGKLRVDHFNVLIQKELERQWEDSKELQKALVDAENATEYMGKEEGIYSWFRVNFLGRVEEREREFFEVYAQEKGFSVDWENDCLEVYHGDDNYLIQSDTRRDNGVWCSGKLVIDESEYKVDGDVDEEKLAFLIEERMNKEGYFPGVFEVSQHGDVTHFETVKRAEAYKARPKTDDESEEN